MTAPSAAALAVSVWVAIGASGGAGDFGPDPKARTASAVADHLTAGLIDTIGVPGMAWAVEIDGEPAWIGTGGHRDLAAGAPVAPTTRFRLASVSKLFAASLAGLLAADGRLDLDASIARYLDGVPDQWRRITARDLAAHLSGIPHYQAQDARRGQVRYETVADALSIFRDRALLFAPGEDYHYSTYGYTLLSAVLEGASGQAYLELTKAELFSPIDARSLGPEDFGRADDDMSRIYRRGDPPVEIEPRDYSYSWAGAGMRGSVGDLVRFGGAHLDGVLMTRAEFEALLEPSLTDDGRSVGRYYFEVGLGWRIGADYHDRRIAHHAGITPGARSALVVFPDHAAAAATLSNASWVAQIERSTAMLAAAFLSENPILAEPDCPAGHAEFSGTFDGGAAGASLRLDWRDGACVGLFEPEGALREWQTRFANRPVESLHAAAFERDGTAVILAVAGATGVFDVRMGPTPDGVRITAVLGSDRTLDLVSRAIGERRDDH